MQDAVVHWELIFTYSIVLNSILNGNDSAALSYIQIYLLTSKKSQNVFLRAVIWLIFECEFCLFIAFYNVLLLSQNLYYSNMTALATYK